MLYSNLKFKLVVTAIFAIFYSIPAFGQTAEEAQALHDKGRACFDANKIVEGRNYTFQAMEMRKALFGEVNEDYINSLNNYAISFSMEKNFSKAIELQKNVLDLCNKLPKPHKHIGMYTMNMGRLYYQLNDLDDAVKYWEQALPLVEKLSDDYEHLLEFLGSIYIDRNDVDNQTRIMALAEEFIKYKISLPCDAPDCMTDKAEYCYMIGDEANAKECYLKALSMEMSPEQKAKTYESYAKYLSKGNDWVASAEYYYMAAEAKKQSEGETEQYIQFFYNAALRMYLGKQYEKSLGYYKKVVEFYEKAQVESSGKYIALCHEGMGNALSAMKQYAAARDEYFSALNYYSKEQAQSKEHAAILAHLASAEKFNNEYDASIQHYREAIAIYTDLGLHEKAQDTQNSLKLCYAYAGKEYENIEDNAAAKTQKIEKLQNIINQELGSLELTRKYLGETQYAQSLGVIAGCYCQLEDYAKGLDYFTQYMQAIRGALRSEFQLMGENERMLLWEEEKWNVDEIKELLVTLPEGNDSLMPGISALAYDCMLLSKGILLNSSIEFEKVIAASGDRQLKDTYEKIKQTNEEITQLRQKATSEADMQKILQLQQQSLQLQLALNQKCAEIADYTNYIGYDWKDVRSKLTDEDVAIEFASIKSGALDDDNYMVAIVLTKDMAAPAVLPICTLADLKVIKKDSLLYVSPLIGNVVWGPLSAYMKDKRNIYFSADGDFNYIGIEYVQYEGKPLSEQKNVYRLSTTKQLCYHYPKTKVENAVLFGNIDYNVSNEKPTEEVQRSLVAMRGAGSSASGEMKFANLEKSRREIEQIAKLLTEHKVGNVVSMSDAQASDEAFLSLNDSKVNILHIASHGAYREEVKSKDENDAMKRSFLAFAGANLGDGYGIVTAADIAKMNLRHCDLAVLSACETALGQMGADGVFGLQRGFKNAGVHTLLMSLRNVYDAATAEMMIQFYRAFLSGQSYREALRTAQQYMREHGYDKPEYWATFVLLDGLE